MAIQIIPEQGVGESLGAGLGAGLQGLAQLKTQDLMRRQQAQYNVPLLQGLFPGVGNQQLQQLAMSDPSLINQLLRRQYETQQGAQLAGIIKDPRLAGLNPSQISAYMSSPEYAKARAMKEASGTIGDIKKSIEGGVSGGKFSGFVSGLMGGKKSSYDALVSQLGTSNDPLIKSLAAGLGAAPDDKTRRTIFNTFVKNNPESMPQVGKSIDNIHNQFEGSEGSQQQAMGNDQQQTIGNDQPQQQDGLIQEAPERTLEQQATGVGAELVKSPASLVDSLEALTNLGKEYITEPISKKLGLNDNFMTRTNKELEADLSNAIKAGSEGVKGFVNNIAEKISPGSTSEKGIGIGERAFRDVARSAPLIALSVPFTAAGIASSLASNLGGAAVGEYLKDEGFGLGGQLVGNLGASFLINKGFGALGRVIQKAPENTTIGKFKSSLYGNATELGGSTEVGKGIVVRTSQGKPYGITEKIKDFIAKAGDNEYIGTGYTAEQQKALIKNAKTLETNLIQKAKKGVRVSLNDVTEELKKINVNYDSSNTLNGRLYREFRGIVADSLEEAGKTNSEWYKAWKPAQQLHAIENWQAPFTKALKAAGLGDTFTEIAAKALVNPFVTSLRLGGKALTAGAAYGVDQLGKGHKYLEFMLNNPQGKALAERLIMAAAQNKGGEIFKTLEAMNKFYDKHDKTVKEEVNKKINV
jgi:hypothetical protein